MTADMLGILRPQIYRFKLGDFEITNILDGVFRPDGPHPIFGNDQTPETVQAYAVANHIPPDKFDHCFTITIVNTGKELVLFDTGFGPLMRDKGVGKLRELLPLAGYSPEDIDVVVITHGHPDHIGGLIEDGKPAFVNARHIFGKVEYDFWHKNEGVSDQRKDNQALFVKLTTPFADQAQFIMPDEEIVSGITSVDAYGHSPGLMAFHFESAGKRLLLWADITNHYILSLQKPEWQVAFDDIRDQAVATRLRLLDMVATEEIFAIGYHMPFPSVGLVERTSESYRWVPASYQLNF